MSVDLNILIVSILNIFLIACIIFFIVRCFNKIKYNYFKIKDMEEKVDKIWKHLDMSNRE